MYTRTYTYISIYICICIGNYICTCIYVYIRLHTIYICINTFICIYVYIYMHHISKLFTFHAHMYISIYVLSIIKPDDAPLQSPKLSLGLGRGSPPIKAMGTTSPTKQLLRVGRSHHKGPISRQSSTMS